MTVVLPPGALQKPRWYPVPLHRAMTAGDVKAAWYLVVPLHRATTAGDDEAALVPRSNASPCDDGGRCQSRLVPSLP